MPLPYVGNINFGENPSMAKAMGLELENAFNRIRNQYEPERLQTGIDLTRAQTGLTGAQTGLTGAQTGLTSAQTQYYPPLWQNQAVFGGLQNRAKTIEVENAERQAILFKQILDDLQRPAEQNYPVAQPEEVVAPMILEGLNAYGQPPSMMKQTGAPRQPAQPTNISGGQNRIILQPGNQNLRKYDDAFLNNPAARQMLQQMFPGTGVKTDINDTTGEATSTYTLPSGEISTSVAPIKKPSGFKGANVKEYEEATKKLGEGATAIETINELGRLIQENSKTAEGLLGPVVSKTPDWLLPAEEFIKKVAGKNRNYSDIRGRMKALLGNVVVETARDIKGPYKGAEADLIDSFKPTMSDPMDVFMGKLRGLATIQQLMQKRRELYAQYLDAQYPAHEAEKIAREQTPFSQVRREVNESFQRYVTLQKQTETGMEFKRVPAHEKQDINYLKKQGFSEVGEF